MAEYADQLVERKRDGRLTTKQGRRFKTSSLDTFERACKQVVAEFGRRPLGSVQRVEAIVWAEGVSAGVVAVAVGLFGHAMDEELIDRNPFRGLVRRGAGRSDDAPPTPDEFAQLLNGCDALGDYADQMRALMLVGADTGMRPGELFALEWADIDLAAHRIHVRRRLYRGELDLPKSNRTRTIALPPPARDVLMRQPTRHLETVFASKTGRRLSQPTLAGYWAQVKAAAGLDFDFYMVTKHLAVHRLYGLGLSTRAIATQMGWAESQVEKLLRVYGHAEHVALREIDALYDRRNPDASDVESRCGRIAAKPR